MFSLIIFVGISDIREAFVVFNQKLFSMPCVANSVEDNLEGNLAFSFNDMNTWEVFGFPYDC